MTETATTTAVPPATQTVTDGYFRWTDVVWHWAKDLDPYHRNALTALTHTRALGSPDHPLVEAGKEGVELYTCTLSDGIEYLCFSLKQVQYIVHFIHKNRMADPAYLDYKHALATAKGDQKPDEPPLNPEIKPVPLPNTFLPASLFVDVKTTVATSGLKKLHVAVTRRNKALKKRGGLAAQSASATETETETDTLGTATPAADRLIDSKKQPEVEDPPVEIVVSPPPAAATVEETLQACAAESLEADVQTPSPDAYYNLVQQAVILAGTGGVMAAWSTMLNKENELDGVETETLESGAATPESEGGHKLDFSIGRTLFIALDVRTSTDNEVVDVGYSALWYAENPESGEYENAAETGHWIAQEEYTAESLTDTSPYAFGQTLPFPRRDLAAKLKRKLFELWRKAGGGATYVILHSPDSDMDALAALSLDVAEWGLDLHPPEWDYAAHANSLAKGKRFVVNTAQLWAAVEVGQEDDQSKDGVTTRTVKNVLEILFGEPIRIDDKGNAGNKATFLMTVFSRLVVESSLDSLRTMFQLAVLKQIAAAAGITKEDDPNDTSASATPAEEPNEPEGDPDDYYDPDFEGGTFYVPDSDDDDEDN